MGYTLGAVVGIVSCVVASIVVEDFTQRELEKKAELILPSSDTLGKLNETFARTGQGMVSVKIGDKACVIDLPKGLKAGSPIHLACR